MVIICLGLKGLRREGLGASGGILRDLIAERSDNPFAQLFGF